jgi:hypothetical protein
LAKPGLSGFSSNSSEQTTQTLMGKAITHMIRRSQPSPEVGAVVIGLRKPPPKWSRRNPRE